jgi:hypothetical protein
MPSRIEREIEEILTRLDEFVPNESRARRLRRRIGARWAALWGRVRSATRGISGGHIVLGAAVLLVLAMFLRGAAPTFARWATYVGLGIVFGAIILSIWPRRATRAQGYWRGQPVDLRRPGPLTRLRMWWRRRNRHRW